MDIQQLSDIDMSILEEIEKRSEEVDEEDIETAIAKKMKPLCEEATKKLKKDYGEKALTFEIVGPAKLSTDKYESIAFVGTEEVVFEKFTYTQKATVVCIFLYPQENKRILVKDEWLPGVFGPRGASLKSWIDSNTNLIKEKKEFIKAFERRSSANDYKEVDTYGAW